MWPVLLLLLAMAVGAALYFYRFFHRALDTYGVNTKRTGVKVGLGVCAACLGAVCLDITSLGMLIVLHVLAAAWFVQLIQFMIRKLAAERYREGFRAWKKLYGSGILPVLASLILLVFGYLNMHHVVQTDYTVYTDKNIRSEGYRVALIADVHFGVSIDEAELLQICGEISSQEPDLVVLCGDIIDDATSAEDMEVVFRTLGTIESAYGSFYVYGNHDRPMAMLESQYTEDALIRAIESSGITILQDETVFIGEDLVLAGREDQGYGQSERLDIDTLLEDVNPEAFIVTLDHQPRDYAACGRSRTDLLLSGHTHGGQLWPVNVIDSIFKFNDAVYGHTWIDEDTQAVVTSGLAGWGYPIKTAAPAEYVIVHIQRQTY